MIVFLNGKYLPAEDARISLFDGGYLYGDGMFETVRLYAGRPFDLEGHLRRLCDNLEALGHAARPGTDELGDVIGELVLRNGLTGQDCRCRITVSRSGRPEDPLPLSGHGEIPSTISVFLQPLDKRLADWQKEGVAVRSMHAGFSRGNFPHLKTLNYLTTVTALRLAHAEGCLEALLIDADDNVLEGATSNIFIIRDGELITPPLALGLLAGRTRDTVLALARDDGLPCRETCFTVADVRDADEAFISGSVKEIVPVIAVDGEAVGSGHTGPLTRSLQKKYRRGVVDSLGGNRVD